MPVSGSKFQVLAKRGPDSHPQRESVSEKYIKSLPKTELHVHLEGATTPAILLDLSRKYQTEYRDWSEQELVQKLFAYEDFYDFLKTYKIVCEHLREPADYLRVLDSMAEYLSDQNIRYAEITYTPSIPWGFERKGEDILVVLLKRGREIESQQKVIIRWILDCVRQFGSGAARRTAELAYEFQGEGAVGLGLGGDENSLAMEEYAEVFSWARAHQLHLHVHAGEIGDSQQVWKAVKVLAAKRIGHGIQAARDPELIDYLRDHAVALDVCLTSNLKTRAWAPISDNPFGLLYKRGVPVTLNTDDPGLFQTSLISEYLKAARFFEMSREDIHRIVLQGVRSSFLPHGEKMKLMQQFQDEIHRLSEAAH